MICSTDDDRMAGQSIHLNKQRADDALDFSGFVRIAAFLADGIEFVKEQHAGIQSRVVDQNAQAI
ncbi:hypothetical protein JCM10599A_08820 [Paraburkholderia kururiensis]